MLRQIQSAQSCKPEARYTINPTQARWNAASVLYGNSRKK